eukprot:gnl/Spiro4/16226_TR8715_c0_g1_i1.p1 gnl/Spiro4/16226_TR8715_c0_g1~~gnl/Spiro4/16226_TR8715_c0_g1_i1.p1  ORF type:complete len:218 (-),score=48.29 gnl/Spiro4/16226_TR8715_c0_g1_i1:113-766(-)
MKTFALLLFVVIGLASATMFQKKCSGMGCPVESDHCAVLSSCLQCVRNPECGWCPEYNTCMAGTKTGPTNGNCTIFDYGFCAALPCQKHTDCGACARDPYCGWCGEGNGVCHTGNEKGPVSGICQAWSHNRCDVFTPSATVAFAPRPEDAGKVIIKAIGDNLDITRHAELEDEGTAEEEVAEEEETASETEDDVQQEEEQSEDVESEVATEEEISME